MNDELNRLVGIAQDRTRHLDDQLTSAVSIYAAAKLAALTMPEPLGSALAGVFAMAEYERRQTGLGGVAGDSATILSLALAVIECTSTRDANAPAPSTG